MLPSQIVTSALISFGLEHFYHLKVICQILLTFISKLLVDIKHFIASKHSVDFEAFSVNF